MIVLAVVVPLALVVGYMLATPDSSRTFLFLLLVVGVLSMPIFLRWHHPLLALAWNASAYFVLLPGQPPLWLLFAFISLTITVLNKVMESESPWLNVPSVTRPLLFLALVVIVTTQLTGGWGLAALGSETYGGKKTVLVIAAMVGFFALSTQPVPLAKAQRYLGMYTLSSLTAMLSNLAYIGGPAFYFLYYVIPTDFAMSQAVEDYYSSALAVRFSRLTGVTVAATGLFQYLLARYGIRGVFQSPVRIVLMAGLLALTTLGGFRSALVLCGLAFAIQFFLEGLHRTRLLIVLLVSGVLTGALLVPFAQQLPLSVQRAISFLPIEVDPFAKADAQSSTEWRWDMWRVVASQIPKYFWLGKGYAINPTDLYLAEESRRRGLAMPYEVAMISGDYHSGPLSIQISFGIFGTVGFIWFQLACLRMLYRNYRWGDPSLKIINTFLLAWFAARIICYWFLFGAFNSDLMVFTGLAGLSICLNHGMAKPPEEKAVAPA
jgi:O-antigen ligase